MTRKRLNVVVTTALLVVLSACNNGSPATTAARDPAGKPLHYIALGGDDAYGARQRLDNSWPQLLFRENLPANATLVNLASPRHGAAEIRDDELPVALRLRPDIVTITALDDLERATNPADVQSQLSAIIRSLRALKAVRVLVGTAPLDIAPPSAVSAFNVAVTTAARASGAELVDLGSVNAANQQQRGEQIASAFARVLAGTRP